MIRRLIVWVRSLHRRTRCAQGLCPGRVISGWRGKTMMIGFCCNDCGKVSHYAPAHRIGL